jgi:transcriptional regulator with XRE-family HTH domain
MNRPRKKHMTNQEVADLLFLTHSAVSRLRNGTRSPSLQTMVTVETALDWPLNEQITAKIEDTYATYLEGQIAKIANG